MPSMQAVGKEGFLRIILAADGGVKAYPTTMHIPKVLIEFDGTTLLDGKEAIRKSGPYRMGTGLSFLLR